MTREAKIRELLLRHGCQDAAFDWESHNFVEAHFYFHGKLIIVRMHKNMNDLIEVFLVQEFFCAGDSKRNFNETPDMDHVTQWITDMLEGKPLYGAPAEPKPA